MKTFAFRLTQGQDLKKEIVNFVKTNNLRAGVILTCVGSLEKANLRMAAGKESKVFEEPFEIVSLVGTLSQEGCHLHISLSDKEGKMIGGHMKDGCIVRTTAEFVIGESEDLEFLREFDNSTNFKELKVKKR